jgi:hypothetical protein
MAAAKRPALANKLAFIDENGEHEIGLRRIIDHQMGVTPTLGAHQGNGRIELQNGHAVPYNYQVPSIRRIYMSTVLRF